MVNCPFCNTSMRNGDNYITIEWLPENDMFAVVCGQCDASGPLAETEEAAREAWNRRATTLPEGAVGLVEKARDLHPFLASFKLHYNDDETSPCEQDHQDVLLRLAAALETQSRERAVLAEGLRAIDRGVAVQLANGKDLQSYRDALALIEGEKREE